MKSKQKIIGSIVILVLIGVFFVVGVLINKPKDHKFNEEDIFVDSKSIETVEKSEVKLLTVYINGEVQRPGVYRVKSGSIVDDLIKQAGGYTAEANTSTKLNLARKLKDEDYVFIEKKQGLLTAQGGTAAPVQAALDNGKIDLNYASLEELDKLPGVGPVTAQKIIDYREKHGAFNSIEDLKNIDGIGDKTINNFRDKVDIR